MDKIIAFVITAGHLDIEWYQPLRSYRYWTIETMEDLKKAAARPDFGLYVLDGQVFPLEEYLEVVPEDEDTMKRLIRERKLSVGPFYTQFDEWLPSAENIIRNCLYGNRRAKKYGGVMHAGYLPDNFGHPRQLPQILRNFGINSLMFMRGMPELPEGHPDEFWYEGLDGSRVLSSHFRESYAGAFDIFSKPIDRDQPREVPYYPDYLSFEYHKELAIHDDPVRIARNMIDNVHRILPRYPSHVIPLIAGFDHLPPQLAVGETIHAANAMQNEITFVMGDAEEYINFIQDRLRSRGKTLPVYREELLGSRYQYVLLGALSTRSYLKRQNFACEALLERYAEPLLAMAKMRGYKDHPRLLEEAWENMLKNSAHDSIHGSSVDEVHTEMEARFASVRQIASGLIHESMAYLGKKVERRPDPGTYLREVIAYAPEENANGQAMEVWVSAQGRKLMVTDENGRRLPSQMISRQAPETNGIGKAAYDYCPDRSFEKIEFFDRIRPGELRKYRVVEAEESREPAVLLAGDDSLENEFVRVKVENGLLHLTDKRSGKTYHHLNLLVEDADAGDAWDYSPPWTPGEINYSSSLPFTSRCVSLGEVSATLEVRGEMSVPACLHGDNRSSERLPMPLTFEITVRRNTPRVDVKLTLRNYAKDHRIRLRVPCGVMSERVLSQGHLAVTERTVTRPVGNEKWVQPPTRLLPFQKWIAVNDNHCGLAIAAKGLYDYEAENDPIRQETVLSFTLLRCFAYMGRTHMMQRDGEASGAFRVPGAQCLGEHTIEWSFIPYLSAEETKTPFLAQALSFLYPPVVHALRSLPDEDAEKEIPAPADWDRTILQYSAFKEAMDHDGFILRLFEPQGKSAEAKIRLRSIGEVWLSNMNEDELEKLEILDGQVSLSVKPYEAITLKLKQ